MGADTKKTLHGEAAHLRLVIVVSLSMAASAEAPLSPMLLLKRLPSEGQSGNGESSGMSVGADTWEFRALGGLLEHLQHQVALEALQESSCSFGTEHVPTKTASTSEWRRVLRGVNGR